MTPRLTVVLKGGVEALPPVLSLLHLLTMRPDLQVHLVCSEIQAGNRAELTARGIEVTTVGPEGLPPANPIGKLWYWARFRNRAWRAIDPGSPLWIASGETAVCLGPRLRRRRYVLHLHELYDFALRYHYTIGAYLRRAGLIVVPEANRAAIYRAWYRLGSTPAVLPNKPHYHPRSAEHLPLPAAANELSPLLARGDRIVLYQGHLHPDRPLTGVARAIHQLGPPWRFVTMGRPTGILDALRQDCPGLVHVPHLPAPQHLSVTARASVGVLTYDYSSLNNVFCAPNKVWEFAGFGVPMLAEALPGLESLISRYRCGAAADLRDADSVRRALTTLQAQDRALAAGSAGLFDAVDLPAILQELLARFGVPPGSTKPRGRRFSLGS